MSDGLWMARIAPSLDDFVEIAQAAFADLPAEFRAMVGEVVFRIDEFPAQEVMDELGTDDPFEISGLYHGVDLGSRSVLDPEPHVSMIWLYRRPILDEWAERGDLSLRELVSHILVHEIGHHFGLSDDDIDAIEAD